MIHLLTRVRNNQPVLLTKRLANSGEGEVWETNLNGYLAKIYHSPTPERIDKLKVMLANPPEDPMRSHGHISIAWIEDLLKNGSGSYVGFLMPAISNSKELTHVYHPGLRQKTAPGFNWYYLHITALNVAWIVEAIHNKGYVVGDMKMQNILVNDRALVAVLDTDSFQVHDPQTNKLYRCNVGSEGFTPAELLGKDFSTIDRTEYHDRFGLGVSIYQLLFGTHPFSEGTWTGLGDPPEQTERIRKGLWLYGKAKSFSPSNNTIPLSIIHEELQLLFFRCFNDGHFDPRLRPTAKEWHYTLQNAVKDLEPCQKIDNHHHSKHSSKCYWCERAAKLGVDIFPGSAVTAKTITNTVTPNNNTLFETEELEEYLIEKENDLKQNYNKFWVINDFDDIGKLNVIVNAYRSIFNYEIERINLNSRVFPENIVVKQANNSKIAICFLNLEGNSFTARIKNLNGFAVTYKNIKFYLWRDCRRKAPNPKTVGKENLDRFQSYSNCFFYFMKQKDRLDFELVYKLILDIHNRDLDIDLELALKYLMTNFKDFWLFQWLR